MINMADFVWTEQLSVGNEVIDSEHENLINMASELMCAIRKRNTSDIARAFKHFEHRVCLHFANEEKIARAIKFDFSYHELAQQYALNELRFLRALLLSKKCLWFDDALEHFIHFLKNWMIDYHINKVDMRMKHALQAYPYDLRIGGELG